MFALPDITLEGLGEFLTVVLTRDEVEGLHNCLEINIAFSEKYCYRIYADERRGAY